MKKAGSINGLIIGIIAIFGSFLLEGGNLKNLFLVPPLIIVFGGTFAAVIIGFGMDRFIKVFVLMKKAYTPEHYDLPGLIETFVDISIKVRQFGLLSIEKEIDRFEHYFTKKLLRFMLDGSDAESLEMIARAEIRAMQDRHMSGIFVFTKMGGYAPTMGILGTVMGLIMTLASAGNDPSQMIHGIASAFIATLWGVLSANLLWLPVGDKLKQCHTEEKHLMEVSLEGVLALHSGEIPSLIRSRMASLLSRTEQDVVLT